MKKIILLLLVGMLFYCGDSQVKQTKMKTKTNKAPVFKKQVKNVQYGLTVNKRKKIFYDLVKMQDKGTTSQYMEDCYKTISKKYKIKTEELRSIAVEGSKKNWPLPNM